MVMSTFTQYEKHVSTSGEEWGDSLAHVPIWGVGGRWSLWYLVLLSLSPQVKVDKTDSGHHDVNDALKKINRHLSQTFIRDFPFYLVIAYKMQA